MSELTYFGHMTIVRARQVFLVKNGLVYASAYNLTLSTLWNPTFAHYLKFNKKPCDFHAILAFYTWLGIGIIMNSFLIVANIFLNKLFPKLKTFNN